MVVLDPWKVLLAGIISCLLAAASVLGALVLVGVFSSDEAQAYGAYDPGVGAKRWYFPEGYTGPGFEEWLLLFNPPEEGGGSGNTALPLVMISGNEGLLGNLYGWGLAPGQRLSININDVALEQFGYSGDVSIAVETDYPIIAERALYFDYKRMWTGGSQVLGYNEGPNEGP